MAWRHKDRRAEVGDAMHACKFNRLMIWGNSYRRPSNEAEHTATMASLGDWLIEKDLAGIE